MPRAGQKQLSIYPPNAFDPPQELTDKGVSIAERRGFGAEPNPEEYFIIILLKETCHV